MPLQTENHNATHTTEGVERQRSLVLIKPDGTVRRQAGIEVIKALRSLPGAALIAFKEVVVPEPLAEMHYAEHHGKPFYPWLCHMIAAPSGVVAMVYEGDNVVKKIRDLLGPTWVDKASMTAPACMRAQHGTFLGVNIAHASDCGPSGARESGMWIAALELPVGEEAANQAADQYLAAHDGRRPDKSKEVQHVATELRNTYKRLREVIASESDLGDAEVDHLMNTILLTLKP
eukprot:m51a1_g14310 nucleoside-diphosphate kinase, putative (232) ;mRNA; f:491739-492991